MEEANSFARSAFFDWACGISSLVIRLGSYIFLRWIPGHVFPQIILSAFVVYLTSFAYLYRCRKDLEVVSKENNVAIVEKPTLQPALSSENVLDAGEKLQLLREMKSEDPEENSVEEPHLEFHATETILVRRKNANPITSLFVGLPSPGFRLLSWATLLLNCILVAFVLDLTYRSSIFHRSKDLSFARPGYVSPTSARVLLREPDPNALPVEVSYKRVHGADGGSDKENSWKTAAIISELSAETDFVTTIDIHGLEPDRKYNYRTSNGHTGLFKTAPPQTVSLLKASRPHGKFTFLSSSCIKPRVPYNPLDHPLSIKGFKYLGDVLRKGDDGEEGGIIADFMLFLGDFIYIDVPRRPSGEAREGYRMHYRQVYNSPDWAAVGEKLPWLHVVDDHEIANDWDRNVTGIYSTAMDPFNIYQHAANPPPHRTGETYYSFNHGAASFFMLDSRRYRSPSHVPDGPGKTFLGQTQLQDLLAWVKDDGRKMHDIHWKIMVTSSPFTKNWRFDTTDTWGVYLHERQKILEAMWSMGGKFGFVILSGDRHEFGATAFPPPNSNVTSTATVVEFSCSPLSQFYLPKRTYHQRDMEDVQLKYIPDGNSKFGAIEVDATNKGSGQAVLKYRLFVDGKETWDYVLTKDLHSSENGGLELWN